MGDTGKHGQGTTRVHTQEITTTGGGGQIKAEANKPVIDAERNSNSRRYRAKQPL